MAVHEADKNVSTLGEFYRLSWALGLRSLLAGHVDRSVVGRVLNPLSYPRYREYQLTLRGLQLRPCQKVLDIGSPKLLAMLLARRGDLELTITDIRDYFISSTRWFLEALGCGKDVGENLHLERQDGRNLTYASDTFDCIFAVSVVEHIPEDGDSQAMAEIGRVLKPDGTAVLTVPFSNEYAEEFVDSDVYERRRQGQEAVFYQRRYDDAALQNRLIAPSALKVESISYFGEPFLTFEHYWNRLPIMCRLPWLWLQPFIGELLLRELPNKSHSRALGVCLALRKTKDPV